MEPFKGFSGDTTQRETVGMAPDDAETLTMDGTEGVILVTTPGAGTGLIALPSAASRRMEFISFRCVADGGGEVRIVLADGSTNVLASGDELGAVGDGVLLFSDGIDYFTLFEETN